VIIVLKGGGTSDGEVHVDPLFKNIGLGDVNSKGRLDIRVGGKE
jgi:hypothetical protein